jgi:hypothetical protein
MNALSTAASHFLGFAEHVGPTLILYALVTLTVDPGLRGAQPWNPTGVDGSSTGGSDAGAQLTIYGIFLLGVKAGLAFFAAIMATAYALAIRRGEHPSVKETLAFVGPRLSKAREACGTLIAVNLFADLIPSFVSGLSGWAEPVVGLALVAVTVYLGVRWMVADAVMLSEEAPGNRAIPRSQQLMRGSWWSAFFAGALVSIPSIVFAAILSSPNGLLPQLISAFVPPMALYPAVGVLTVSVYSALAGEAPEPQERRHDVARPDPPAAAAHGTRPARAALETSPTTSYRDRFKIERELGAGGSGKAFLARDGALDRLVVLKQPVVGWLAGDGVTSRFLREARLAARVQHPNVVAVHEIITEEQPPVLVMEYVQGGSLDDVLETRNRLTPEESVRIVADVLAGLAEIHAAGIVHRDLKPANILLTPNGVAKVSDFGIARMETSGQGATVTAGTMAFSGTILYMSPEQARGDPVDARSDIYAVGAILYRALTGDHYLALDGQSDFKARQLIQEALPRLPADGIPWQYEGVIRTALAKSPGERFQTAAAMREALMAAANG